MFDTESSARTSEYDLNTETVDLVEKIEDDLGNALTVEFVSMLKALLALQFQREVALESTPMDELEKYGEVEFTTLLADAIEYCDDRERSGSLKDGLRAWLSTSNENQGCRNLAQALNSVLLDFHEKEIGEGPDFLYVCNGREEINEQKSCSIGKPGIIDLTLAHLGRLLPGNKHLSFSQRVDTINDQQGKLENVWMSVLEEERFYWGDISHCWELRRSTVLSKRDLHELDQKYEAMNDTALCGESFKASSGRADHRSPPSRAEVDVALDIPWLAKRSREDNSDDTRGNKRQKVERRDFETSEDQKENVSPETQCALYAAQLLRSKRNCTHAIVVLLTDNWLSLRWYDAQGTIATFPIDIAAQLPLVVVMIVLFQRFGDRMRGIGDFKLEGEVDGRNFRLSILDTARSGWKLMGATATHRVERPLVASHCVQNSHATVTDDPLLPDQALLKLSWREEVRDCEGAIIQTARERVVKCLGDNAGDVLNHLPDIGDFEDYSLFSTRHIRELLGLGTEGACVPSALFSEQLVPLKDVHLDESPARMWEIIRCHYLLWQIGIAHGDISLSNLMVRTSYDGVTHFAVLNDFDLATIMELGQKNELVKIGQDIPDLSGKVAIVTGATAGIGKETAKELLAHNAKVYLGARNREKGEKAIHELKLETGKEGILLELDLSDLKSVKDAAEVFQSKETSLHMLFNNAGVMAPPTEQVTAQGYDMQFGTNVLGHFYFTKLLIPTLLDTAKSTPDWKPRIIHTSSVVSSLASPLDFNTLKDGPARRSKGPRWLYKQSKLANIMVSNELARRFGEQGIISASVNPGNIRTELRRHMSPTVENILGYLTLYPVQLGALTQLWAGTSDEGRSMNGKYLVPWARYGRPNPAALDEMANNELWKWLEEQVDKHSGSE
ncbi:hypothetical protein H1R20_g11178, partial [Candolleomyces eurysporus]